METSRFHCHRSNIDVLQLFYELILYRSYSQLTFTIQTVVLTADVFLLKKNIFSDDVFIKSWKTSAPSWKMSAVSTTCLNSWNPILQAAWYIRHVRIICFLWTVASARRSGQEDCQRGTPPVSLASCSISPFLRACSITEWSSKDHETDNTGASILIPLLLLNFNMRLHGNPTAWYLFLATAPPKLV